MIGRSEIGEACPEWGYESEEGTRFIPKWLFGVMQHNIILLLPSLKATCPFAKKDRTASTNNITILENHLPHVLTRQKVRCPYQFEEPLFRTVWRSSTKKHPR